MSNKKPVYLFYGEEDFLIEEAVRKVPFGEDESCEVVDAKETDLDQILNILLTQPMLFSRRRIVIQDLELLSSPKIDPEESANEEEKRKSERQTDQLIKVLNDLPDEGTTVIFTAVQVDKRKKLFKAIDKLGVTREFKPFSDREGDQVVFWIEEYVQSRRRKITPQAADLLYEIVGSNLRLLASEIEKLITYIGNKPTIEDKDVSSVASFGSINTFFLFNALRDKNLPRALDAISRLLRNREAPAPLLAAMASQYRMLLQVKTLQEEGLNPYRMAGLLGAKPYFVNRCYEKARNFSVKELKRNLGLILQTDLRLKTTGEPADRLLELLLVDLCHG